MTKAHEHDGWSEEDQSEFWELLADHSEPSDKRRLLLTKAQHLAGSGDPAKLTAALEMVSPTVDAYIQNSGGVRDVCRDATSYKDDVVEMAAVAAGACHQARKLDEAYHWSRTMFEVYVDGYAETTVPSGDMFLFAHVATDRCSLRDAEHVVAMVEALQDVENRSWNDLATAARLWDKLGQTELASAKWRQAWTTREGWVPFELLREAPSDATPKTVEHAAESAIKRFPRARHHASAGVEALRLLDDLPHFAIDEIDDAYRCVVELGSLFGEIVASSAGQWQINTPLIQSSILVGANSIDPFRIAFERIYFERSLLAAFEAIAAS